MKHRVALVTHDVTISGGTASVIRFLYTVLVASGRYLPDVISLATSASDHASVRLASPTTWLRGVRVVAGHSDGRPYHHVGAWLVEVEAQRYRPRRALTEILNAFDVVLVVGGTPTWAMAASETTTPLAMFAATRTANDRAARLTAASGPRTLYLRGVNNWNAKIESRALRRADIVFAESEYTRAQFCGEVESSRLRVAPPGVDSDLFHPEEYGDRAYILSVGRFSDPRKNISQLIDAYALAVERNPSIPRLVLAGAQLPAEQCRRLEALRISDRVSAILNPNVETLASLYRNAILFVLPSQEEGLGIVLLEAMSSGTPVLSTRCGGPETIIEDGTCGRLVSVGSPEAMADTLLDMLNSPSILRKMGESGRALVEQKYSYQAAGRIYLETLDQMLSDARE